MQKLVEVRERIRNVANIGGVCRTMATVAAAKLSQTRERAAGMREYTNTMRAMLDRQQRHLELSGVDVATLSPYLARREVREVTLLHIASDRGMCGGYNLAVHRVTAGFVEDMRSRGVEVRVVTKGTRGERYVRRRLDVEVLDAADWPRAGVTPEEVDRLGALLADRFLSGAADEVWCTYTRFVTPVQRVPCVVRLLPITLEEVQAVRETGPGSPERWFYEPSVESIVTALLAEFVRLQVEDVLLESYASEHAARMITMEEAVERADKTLQELRVRYNRLRREAITTDMLGVLYAGRLRGGASHG